MEPFSRRFARYTLIAAFALLIAFVIGVVMFVTGFLTTGGTVSFAEAIEGSFRSIVGMIWLPIILWLLVILVWNVKPPRSTGSAYVRSVLIAIAVGMVTLFLGLSMADSEWGSAILGIAILAGSMLFISISIASALVLLWIMRPTNTEASRH